MTRTTINLTIDSELKRKFLIFCALNEKSASEIVENFIEKTVQNLQFLKSTLYKDVNGHVSATLDSRERPDLGERIEGGEGT